MKKLLLIGCVIGMLAFAANSNAIPLAITSVSGTGSYNGDVNRLIDGYFPTEGSSWKSNTVWWRVGSNPVKFTFDMGDVVTVEDITLSVNFNDNYRVDYSVDGKKWARLFTIRSSYGESRGMDTMTTLYSEEPSEYIEQIDFSTAVSAQYLRIFTTNKNLNRACSIGEFQVAGSPAPVPEPATMLLFGSGLLGLAVVRRKIKR